MSADLDIDHHVVAMLIIIIIIIVIITYYILHIIIIIIIIGPLDSISIFVLGCFFQPPEECGSVSRIYGLYDECKRRAASDGMKWWRTCQLSRVPCLCWCLDPEEI